VLRASDVVRFAWGVVGGAATYTLSVSTDAAMTNVVPGFPMTTTAQLVEVSIAPGTYYWRAIADATSSNADISSCPQPRASWSAPAMI
jgi:hypothetical protein